MPAKILYVNHSARVSGAEQSLIATLEHLNRARFAPTVACPEGDLAERLDEMGVACFPAPLSRFNRSRNPLSMALLCTRWMRGQRALRRIAREGGFSLFHANSTTAHVFSGTAAAKLGLPCVWHVRDLSSLKPVGDYCARRARSVVCISRAVADHVLRNVTNVSDLRVIHNGIDADAFAAGARDICLRDSLGWPKGAFVAAMVGQFVPWKRHEDFIGAIRLLADSECDVRGVVAGDDLFNDQAAYAARLRQAVSEEGLSDRIAFLGWRDDADAVIKSSDALVVPSDAEPFGRVALEAMALAKPVVGTRAGGLPEILEDGITGLLAPVRDPGALAEALRRLATETDLAREMGAAGVRRACEHFDIRDKVAEIESLYRTLLGAEAL